VMDRTDAHQQVISALDAACEGLAGEAQDACNEYFEKAKERALASSGDPQKKFVPVLIMIRRREATETSGLGIEILWARRYPVKTEGSSRIMTKALPKGTKNQYARRSIGHSPAWFEELFAEFEPRLAALRALIKANRQARQMLNKNFRANS